jgi:hypothetical protein
MSGWHIGAVRLPTEMRSRMPGLSPDGWSDRPIPDADDLPGSFSLPGLVDAHRHVSFGDGGDGPLPCMSCSCHSKTEL